VSGLVLNQLKQVLPIGSRACYGCSSTHNNTLQVLHRTTIGPSPPKDSSTCEHICMTASFQLYQSIESDRSCMCVLSVLILTLSLRFFFYMISELFRHCGILCVFSFHFILIKSNIKSLDDLSLYLWRHVLNVARDLTEWKWIENRTVNFHSYF